jgi:elongation factor Ts
LIKGNKAAVIEVNTETDFVARNDKFQQLVTNLGNLVLNDKYDLDSFKKAAYPEGGSVEEAITNNIATIGENISLRRIDYVEVSNGVIVSYIHNGVMDNFGKIAVLVALESSANKDELTALGKQIAMHIAAAKPLALTIEGVDPALVANEKAVATEKARLSGKPDNIIEKMVEGNIRKYYEEVVLMEQVFVIDGKTKIKDLLVNESKRLGSEVNLSNFALYVLGAGIEKQEDNFADEVNKMAGK